MTQDLPFDKNVAFDIAFDSAGGRFDVAAIEIYQKSLLLDTEGIPQVIYNSAGLGR